MIKRGILQALEEHLSQPEMTVLIGPRQVGKTYLMEILKQRLEDQGEKTVFLSLDRNDHKQLFVSQNKLVSYLTIQLGNTRGYVFIDEIQRKEDAGLFLKGIYDMHLPFKLIISGSGSLDLKAKIKESMAGRKRLFVIDPISFEEFANFKTAYRYVEKLQDFFALMETEAIRLLEEYMVFGGYPRVVLADTVEKKKIVMDEIYTSYIERDIRDLLSVEKPEALTNLLKILASQIGSLVNIAELSSTVGISAPTIQHYLWYLEQTFIINKVTPYFRNIRSEITKAPVYYFYDIGLRNWLLELFGLPQVPPPLSGHLFENLVFNMLRLQLKLTSTQIHFWRTRDQAEVDFILQTGLAVIPIEVKYKKMVKPEVTRSYRSFLTKYKPRKAYIVHLGERMQEEIEGTKIDFIPYYESANITKKLV